MFERSWKDRLHGPIICSCVDQLCSEQPSLVNINGHWHIYRIWRLFIRFIVIRLYIDSMFQRRHCLKWTWTMSRLLFHPSQILGLLRPRNLTYCKLLLSWGFTWDSQHSAQLQVTLSVKDLVTIVLQCLTTCSWGATASGKVEDGNAVCLSVPFILRLLPAYGSIRATISKRKFSCISFVWLFELGSIEHWLPFIWDVELVRVQFCN